MKLMTDAFKSIEQGLKEAIANGATTHHVVIDLVTRLRDWEHIYPCDDLKPDGHLYVEAAERIRSWKPIWLWRRKLWNTITIH